MLISDVDLLNAKIVQCEGNFVTDMAGEKVMLSIQNGKYFNLGVIGGDIWELVKSPVTINGIVANLLQKYDVDAELCQKEVVQFIEQMHQENLIQVI